tara:strand:+ start:2497 stop:3057 length:561 start_codon:yes stop_codon:yes gene_type:complete
MMHTRASTWYEPAPDHAQTGEYVVGTCRGKIQINVESLLAKLRVNLDHILQKNASHLSFSEVYCVNYNLVALGRGEALHDAITDAIRRLSLTERAVSYDRAVVLIRDCAMYLNQVWVPKSGRPRIEAVGEAMYNRPVARRWRRALTHAKWTARLIKWRAAFDVLDAAPNRSGALRAAKRFRACAAR